MVTVGHRTSWRCALCVLQTQIPAERITALAFSPDGATLAAACWGGGIFLYHRAGRASDAAHSGAAAASETAVYGQAALPARGDLTVCPPGAAAAASPEEPLVSAAPPAQPLQTGPAPSGSGVHVRAGVAASKAVACAATPVQALGLAAVDHGVRGSGGWVVGSGYAAQPELLLPPEGLLFLLTAVGGPGAVSAASHCIACCCFLFWSAFYVGWLAHCQAGCRACPRARRQRRLRFWHGQGIAH